MRTYVEPFLNREHAGKELAGALEEYRGTDTLVLAIPRGGVVVGFEVSRELDLDLDVIVPRKLRAPAQPELAIGAVASWGDHEVIVDEQAVRYLGVTREYLDNEVREQLSEINRRLEAYRGTASSPNIEDRAVILVDDGIATGYTTRAAAVALRNLHAEKVIVAVPVGPRDSVDAMRPYVDDIVCLMTPQPFLAVGYWYRDFEQVPDEEVIRLLERARTRK